MVNLDLVKILKNCPKGTKLYSPLFGEVEFNGIIDDCTYLIRVTKNSKGATFTREGKYLALYPDGECMLFPSRDQRDWNKFKVPREDLSIDTPVMVKDAVGWILRYYVGNGYVLGEGREVFGHQWDYIIPFDKFDPNNIEDSVKNFNYGTKQD